MLQERRSFTFRCAAGVLISACAAAAVGGTVFAQGSLAAAPAKEAADVPEGWNEFSVDISIRRSRVDKDGKPKGPAEPDQTYRLQREQTGAGWKTVFTRTSAAKPVVHSVEGRRELDLASDVVPVRIEDDEDGTPLRFYNARGKRLDPASLDELKRKGLPDFTAPFPLDRIPKTGSSDVRRPVGREFAEAFVTTKDKKDKRQKAFEQKFGKARGQVRGLDQFRIPEADGEAEVLVDREFNVPLEMNQIRQGALVSRTVVGYERTPADALVRRSIRTEQVIPDERNEGDRLISDVQFTNVRFAKKGGAR
jgi:hypothetical protein